MDVQTHRWFVRSMLVIRVIVTGITLESVLIVRSCFVGEEVAINKASAWHSVFKTMERAEVSEDEDHSRSADRGSVCSTTEHSARRSVNRNRAIHQSHVIDAAVGDLIRSKIVQQQVPFAIIVVWSGTSVRFVDRPYRYNRHNNNYRSPFLALGKEIKTGHLEEIKLRCL